MISRMIKLLVVAALGIIGALLVFGPEQSALAVSHLPEPAVTMPQPKGDQKAVFAAGCFWCSEAVFEQLKGVKNVVSGFAGGSADTAHYDQVSSGTTNHAESIEVTYDPSQITYGQLLMVLFGVAHDPTQLNRQGPDWGKQYRSEIFYTTPEQKSVAEAYIQQLTEAKVFGKPIVTKLEPLKGFYPAEDYHQDFVRHHPNHPYVVVNSRPKLEKLHKLFPELLKK